MIARSVLLILVLVLFGCQGIVDSNKLSIFEPDTIESAGYSDEFENLAESVRENLGDKKWAELLDQKAKELEDGN